MDITFGVRRSEAHCTGVEVFFRRVCRCCWEMGEGGFPRWVEDLLQDASNDGLDTNGVRMEAAVLQAYFLAVVGGGG